MRSLAINSLPFLRHHHRLALPVLAPAFSRLRVHAEVTLCSSSGWAHGARVTGRKIVYCYTPARWLYQTARYVGDSAGLAGRSAIAALRPGLVAWDRRCALSADRYLAISTAVRQRVRQVYGLDAEVLPPPVTLDPGGSQEPVQGVEPGYWLCVSRLLPYKNVDAVIEAFAGLAGERLVVVGSGPERARLAERAPGNVSLVGGVDDRQLRWLYAHCRALVAASYEDFGLTPLEANMFAKPVAALAWGGFLDTVVEGLNGVLFDQPTPDAIRSAVQRIGKASWPADGITGHAKRFDESHFATRLCRLVEEERETWNRG